MADRPSPTGRMLVARGLYRSWLSRYFSKITLAGLAPDDEPILLRKIFVPLVLTPERVSDYAPEESLHREGKELARWLPFVVREMVLFVSGEAGSGKTTLVSAVVDSLSGEVGDEFNQRLEGFVPFPIRLREAPLARLKSLDELIDWWLEEARRETPELEPADVRAFLDRGWGILLLDGLDEVGTVKQRSRVLRWLKHHRWAPGAGCTNLVVVTARPSGFEGLRKEDLPPALSVHVAPFSREQIRLYLARWFEMRTLRTGQRQETVGALLDRLTRPEQAQRLLPLARRPAYLASLAFVHGTRGELPYTRAALYELLVDAYIEMLDRQRGLLDQAEREERLPVWDRQEKIEVLAAVAFQAHVGATAKEEEARGRTADRRILWSRGEIEGAVRLAVKDGAGRLRTIQPDHVSQLTDYFIARTGLLVETREGQYQFGHLSFQEYLTALFLLNRAMAAADKAAALQRTLFPRLGDPGWLEVGVLALAIDSGRSGGKGHQPVLALLDLREPEQLVFLSQLLSGEEIRFTAEERRAWLLVWLGFWATRTGYPHFMDWDAVLQFPPNRGALEDAWLGVCKALTKGDPPLRVLHRLVEEHANTPDMKADVSGLDLLLRGESSPSTHSSDDRSAPRSAWRQGFETLPRDQELAGARLVVVPQLGGFVPKGAEESLVAVARSADLFEFEKTGQVHPTFMQRSLDSWSIESVDLFWILAERTPLAWWQVDDLVGIRVTTLGGSDDGSMLLQWRAKTWHGALRAEQCWRLSFLTLSGARAQNRARNLDLARDLDLDAAWDLVRARARDLPPDRALDAAWDLARARARARDLAPDRDLALARHLALARAQALARALDRDRSLDRALDLVLALARARALDAAWDPARARDLALDLARALDLLQNLGKTRSSRSNRVPVQEQQMLELSFSALQSLTAAAVLRDSSPRFLRSDAIVQLEGLDPEAVGRPLRGTPFLQQALQEWEQVLASPLSPVHLLEDALSRPWEELPATTEGILDLYRETRDRLKRGE